MIDIEDETVSQYDLRMELRKTRAIVKVLCALGQSDDTGESDVYIRAMNLLNPEHAQLLVYILNH